MGLYCASSAPVTCRRFDVSEFRRPSKTREGWLRADGVLTRVGVFNYRLADGSVRRELRLPEEVFHPDALASFSMVPLTREHPEGGAVDSQNWKAHAVGVVGEEVKRDGEYVRATVLVTDADAVKDLEAGHRRQLSCGYTCDVVEESGEWRGLQFDAVQRNIRGNHVALVRQGRAGPDVRVHLDAEDAEMVERMDGDGPRPQDPPPPRGTPRGGSMVRVRIDGVEYEVPEQAAQAIQKVEAQHKDALAKADEALKVTQTLADGAKAKADELEKKLQESEKARADGADPQKVQALVKARVALEQMAAPILGAGVKLDALDDKAIKVAVLQKAIPGWSAEGKSDGVIEGALEAVAAFRKKGGGQTVEAARGILSPPPSAGAHEDGLYDVAGAHARFIERARNQWKGDAQSGGGMRTDGSVTLQRQ